MSRAALVTGGASGIGHAITERLLADGYEVLAVDLNPAHAGPGVACAADLCVAEENERAVRVALDHFGRLDLVVANAVVQPVAPVAEFPLEQWQALIEPPEVAEVVAFLAGAAGCAFTGVAVTMDQGGTAH